MPLVTMIIVFRIRSPSGNRGRTTPRSPTDSPLSDSSRPLFVPFSATPPVLLRYLLAGGRATEPVDEYPSTSMNRCPLYSLRFTVK